jgi:dTDP-4-dehydrorhamnose reductase
VVWLVTGGSGQLGLALQRELVNRDIEYLAPTSMDLDLTNPNQLEVKIKMMNPNVIVNAAAWTDVDGAEENPDLVFKINAEAPAKLAEIAKSLGSVFVQISTDYVFDGNSSQPYSECHARNPQTRYGESKSQGEKYIEEIYKEKSYVFRTAWLYSADRKNFAKTMTRLCMKDVMDVKVVIDQKGQPTFAGDLAERIIDTIVSNAPFGIYHGTNSGEATWFEFAQEIFNLASADGNRLLPVSAHEFPRPAFRPAYSVLGHKSWHDAGVKEMRNWKIALTSAMPAIIQAVMDEELPNGVN